MAFPPYSGDLLQHLASFVLLADRIEYEPRGAYEGAAEELGIDVSVLRRRMQTLARWFDVDLTEGRGASLRLSRAGEAVLEGAGSMLLDLQRLRERLAEVPERLAIGYDGAFGAGALPAALKVARRAVPDLAVAVSTGEGQTLLDHVRRGRLDMALLRRDAAPEGLQARELGEERVLLLVSRDHGLAERSRISLRDFAGLDLVVERSDRYTRARVTEGLGDVGDRVLEVESRDALVELVAVGVAVGLVAARPRETPRARGLASHDVTRLFSPCSYYAVYDEGRAPSALDAMLDAVERQL